MNNNTFKTTTYLSLSLLFILLLTSCISSQTNEITAIHFPTKYGYSTFPAGEDEMNKYFANNIKYPKESLQNGIQGEVLANCIINKNGAIQDVKIVDGGLDSLCNLEVKRVLKNMPKFTPARANTYPQSAICVIPIHFKIAGDTTKIETPSRVIVENPTFLPGGEDEMNKHIRKNIVYPLSVRRKKNQGDLVASFWTQKDGTIKEVKIIHGLNPKCDSAVINMINSIPRWIPDKTNGLNFELLWEITISFHSKEKEPIVLSKLEIVDIGDDSPYGIYPNSPFIIMANSIPRIKGKYQVLDPVYILGYREHKKR